MEFQEFYDFVVKVHSIAKIGLTYSTDPYAIDNYKELNELSKQMLENFMNVKFDKPSMFTKEVYPTPNISVRTVIAKDNKILLVREANSGLWSLPGAFNEVSQEAGVEPKIVRLIGALERTPHKSNQNVPEYLLVFEGDIDHKAFHEHCHETLDVKFFDMDNLPDMSKKLSMEEIQRIFEAYRKGTVIFD